MTNHKQKIESDLEFLNQCLIEILEDCGDKSLIPFLLFLNNPNENPTSIQSIEPKTVELLSLYFQLLNMVEENSANQYRRQIENEKGLMTIPGLWGQSLKKCLEYGLKIEDIAAKFPEILCEAVLTAHPTEAKRASVLEIHRDLYLTLVKKENTMWTKYEQNQIREEIKQIIERLWRTGEIYLQKPDISSERRNIEYYLKSVFPNVIPLLDTRLKQAWKEIGANPIHLKEPANLPKITFGNWVGGDRDGHPFVTPEITKETLENFASIALNMQREKLIEVTKALSLSDHLQNPPKVLLDKIKTWADENPEIGNKFINRNVGEPWRQYCNFLIYFLDNGITAKEYLSSLEFLRKSLEKTGASRLAEQLIFPLERNFLIFGFHLAKTDIRQNSAYHLVAFEEILRASSGDSKINYTSWTEEKKIEFLSNELKSPRPFLLPETKLEKEASSVLDTYRIIRTHIKKFGNESIGSFIVSMTKEVSDLLLVFLFLRETGLLSQKEDGTIYSPFQVVPLFETIEDLEKAPMLMDLYLSFPIVKSSLHNSYQQIMLGYSDSNKDGGIFASQWVLYQAETELIKIAKKHSVELRFFHGRGGTISRGGGKTHKFLDALPHGSLSGNIRMTVQGETIAQQFANKVNATYNLELFLATTTKVSLRHKHLEKKDHPSYDIIKKISNDTSKIYSELLYSDGFISFFGEATPIDAIEHSKIGSRPARRTGKRSFQDLRAIPWVFSWNQSRFYLPNWYGVGTALKNLKQLNPQDFDFIKQEIKEWHFLNYLFKNIETGLYSTDSDIFSKYAELVKDEKNRIFFLDKIKNEFQITKDLIAELRGIEIEKSRPGMIETIELRKNGLLILHDLQIQLLQKWRKKPEDSNTLNELLLTVNAIASGLRTTG